MAHPSNGDVASDDAGNNTNKQLEIRLEKYRVFHQQKSIIHMICQLKLYEIIKKPISMLHFSEPYDMRILCLTGFVRQFTV